MVRWLRWHCPPDTGFEIRTLAVWGRARYLSVTEAPHNTNFHTWMGKKHLCFFQTAETGNRTPDSGVKGSGANHYPRAPARLSCESSRVSQFAYPRWQPMANLHIQDRHLRSPVVNIHSIFANFFLNIHWWITLLNFENQLICTAKWPPWSYLHIQDRLKHSPVTDIYPIFAIFFWTASCKLLTCSHSKNSFRMQVNYFSWAVCYVSWMHYG